VVGGQLSVVGLNQSQRVSHSGYLGAS
jgi:hypothetical protein